ncbi:hypothetical protein HK098_007874, partial [Nowakowskiella sp. JEL0407]
MSTPASLGSLGVSIYLAGTAVGLAGLEILAFFTLIKWNKHNFLRVVLIIGLFCQFLANLATGYSYALNLADCYHHYVATWTYLTADLCYSLFALYKTWQLTAPYSGLQKQIARGVLIVLAVGLLTGRLLSYVGGAILITTEVEKYILELSICIPILHRIKIVGSIIAGISDVGINILLITALTSISKQVVKNSEFQRHVADLRKKGCIALIVVTFVSAIHPVVLTITPPEFLVIPLLFDQLIIFAAA